MIPGAHPTPFRAARALSARLWPSRRLCSDGTAHSGVTRPDIGSRDAGSTRDRGDEAAGQDAGRFPREELLQLPRPGGSPESDDDDDENFPPGRGSRRRSFDDLRLQASQIFRILLQDGPGFSARQALDEMRPRVSNELVREVLFRMIVSVDNVSRERFPSWRTSSSCGLGSRKGIRTARACTT